eukprot:c19204_g1_i1 orf=252-1055(+)
MAAVSAHSLPLQHHHHSLLPLTPRTRACPLSCMKASEPGCGKASLDVGWRRLGLSWFQTICARHRIDAGFVVSGLRGGKDGVGGFPGDEFGMYPWDPAWNNLDGDSIDWIQEDLVTLFTTDGLIQIGGLKVPRRISSEKKQDRGAASSKYRQYREEDYMDPKQGLCLGAIFDIAATNGLDTGRRFCVFGFCRSIEMLSDVVEDTVLEQGGEVVVAEKGSGGGLNERLSMTVAMPLLWGVPPAVDSLNYAIRSGGGIVEKVYWQWEFL